MTEDLWRVGVKQALRHPERILASRTMRRRDRFTTFFQERVPNWSAGEALVMWVPLSARNIVGGLGRMLLGRPTR